ncbi:hypothetical protein EIP86_003131 [Pleurotus ostreatoroseus]|nr:hypothetical protein EIP86_003131 [Pleurotus ostreatoroseus]
MGVSLPAIPVSVTEDNINLGDKDSIRRRALWTLEGKTDVGAFSKVEIPELDSAPAEKRFEFPTKPSYPPGVGAGYNGGLSGLAGSKRDSFGRFSIPSTSKEHLGTLIEEEEEEDDSNVLAEVEEPLSESLPSSPVEVTITAASPAPARHRPVGLQLRPLSLAPGSVVQASNGDLPSPLPTPSPRPRPGLKSLTLATSSSSDLSSSDSTDFGSSWKRQSLIFTASPVSTAPVRRSSLSEGPPPTVVPPNRRSSISYVSSDASYAATGLPTPEMTPTSDRRYSIDSSASGSSRSSRGSRSLSNSEHHFLYQAHAALVQRITDLERALSYRPPSRPLSRPLSYASDVSAPAEAPSDEMLQLVKDLKAERDELKKDVDGWRTRVSDCERQATLLMNRVEAERRDAWVARERVGLLEVEKRSLETMLQEKVTWGEEGWRKLEEVEKQLIEARDECQKLRDELQRRTNVEAECLRLAGALAQERKRREDLEKELDGVLSTPTPTSFRMSGPPAVSRTMVYANRNGLGFRSIDSTGSSNTDVESLDDFDRHEPSLKVVHEEDEDESYDVNDSGDEELARYEDEEEVDSYLFQTSLSDSSFGSTDSLPRETSHLLQMSIDDVPSLTTTRSNTASPAPASPPQSHARRNSLVKAWTFPAQEEPMVINREPEEIDRFFGCLADVDNSPPRGSKLISVESGKNLFSRALAEADDDEELPFVIPANVGIEIGDSRSVLDVIAEDEEEEEDEEATKRLGPNDEFIGEEVEGGIIFTFSPPLSFDEPTESHPEDVSGSEDYESCQSRPESVQEDDTVMFGHVSADQSLSRIPPPKTFVSAIPLPMTSTPVKANSYTFPRTSTSPGAFSTPPPRRTSSSFVAQPRSQSESPHTSTPVKTSIPSFIPQPSRKPSFTSQLATPMKPQPKPRMSMLDDPESSQPPVAAPDTKVDDLGNAGTSGPSPPLPMSPMSPTITARLSLQKLTNLIPSLPWSSPILGSATSTAASLCLVSSSTSGSIAEGTPSESIPASATTQAQVRKYVSKEQQLQKLRARLEAEQRSSPRMNAVPLFPQRR